MSETHCWCGKPLVWVPESGVLDEPPPKVPECTEHGKDCVFPPCDLGGKQRVCEPDDLRIESEAESIVGQTVRVCLHPAGRAMVSPQTCIECPSPVRAEKAALCDDMAKLVEEWQKTPYGCLAGAMALLRYQDLEKREALRCSTRQKPTA